MLSSSSPPVKEAWPALPAVGSFILLDGASGWLTPGRFREKSTPLPAAAALLPAANALNAVANALVPTTSGTNKIFFPPNSTKAAQVCDNTSPRFDLVWTFRHSLVRHKGSYRHQSDPSLDSAGQENWRTVSSFLGFRQHQRQRQKGSELADWGLCRWIRILFDLSHQIHRTLVVNHQTLVVNHRTLAVDHRILAVELAVAVKKYIAIYLSAQVPHGWSIWERVKPQHENYFPKSFIFSLFYPQKSSFFVFSDASDGKLLILKFHFSSLILKKQGVFLKFLFNFSFPWFAFLNFTALLHTHVCGRVSEKQKSQQALIPQKWPRQLPPSF